MDKVARKKTFDLTKVSTEESSTVLNDISYLFLSVVMLASSQQEFEDDSHFENRLLKIKEKIAARKSGDTNPEQVFKELCLLARKDVEEDLEKMGNKYAAVVEKLKDALPEENLKALINDLVYIINSPKPTSPEIDLVKRIANFWEVDFSNQLKDSADVDTGKIKKGGCRKPAFILFGIIFVVVLIFFYNYRNNQESQDNWKQIASQQTVDKTVNIPPPPAKDNTFPKQTDARSSTEPVPDTETIHSEGNASIEDVIKNYYQAVEEKRVQDAINMYSSEMKYKTSANILAAVAKDTEYYMVDKIEVRQSNENKATTLILLWHKQYGKPAEKWEINASLVNESGDWKIYAMAGRRL